MHQYERLLVVHAHMLIAPTFPSGLLNQPSRWDFHFAIGLVVVWHRGIFLKQGLKLCPFDDGVLEETACTANLFHVRQFGIADRADDVVELLQSGAGDPVFLQIRFDVAIFEVERRVFLQQEVH